MDGDSRELGGLVIASADNGAIDDEAPVEAGPADWKAVRENRSQSRFAVIGMTCGNCAWHVEEALENMPGVGGARVALAAGTVDVTYDATAVSFPALQEAVRAAGYDLDKVPVCVDAEKPVVVPRRRIPGWPVAAGVAASAFLTGFYIALVSLAQGFDHALELIAGDWYFVIPIVLGFGTQMGLFVYLRTKVRLRQGTGTTKALAGAGTGTSTVSMVACCAHHLTDVLPIVGLSGAALFLNEFRGPLMGLGILTIAIGIWVMLRVIRQANQCSPSLSKLLSEPAAGSA